ncbi:Histidine ABC transporter, ATP-binding protein HisP [Caenispirillum salinarum AK4]|uniref:Histidine ABC transporter, ATP-binding protein HisP n=1 Tax=Caenispirillum salinarum AK4 TaxID=1238182 RepID=K9GQC0_9PROT|nr:ATP-binding cassette domain-containing protein [Caenispirillum salinarum]EKV28130.1 Histidine ABC transporter, ATP-binding protein HisP [Caenispirillum salinarum AK4]
MSQADNAPPAPQTAAPTLEVVDIHKRFGGLEVLKGISLEARDGDVISIIGSSGSGKSTFLRCINFLETPDTGLVRIGGEEVRVRPGRGGKPGIASHKQLERLRTRVGMVFQSFNLWPHLTILENVMEAPVHVLGQNKAEVRDRAMALLDKVGIAAKRDHYPNHLSGGQQQRAAIARALCMEPQVILFDEPTSALDPELVVEVLGVIRKLADEGRTMLIVTHEMAFARDVSSQIMFLHEGRVEEQGPPSKLFKDPSSERLRQFLANHLH